MAHEEPGNVVYVQAPSEAHRTHLLGDLDVGNVKLESGGMHEDVSGDVLINLILFFLTLGTDHMPADTV